MNTRTHTGKADFDLILQTLVQGIMEYNDAVGRKAAFAIMLQMVTRWGEVLLLLGIK